MNCAEDYLKFLCRWLLQNCSDDMKFITKRIDQNIVDRLQSVPSCSFERITYDEAVTALYAVNLCPSFSGDTFSIDLIIPNVYCTNRFKIKLLQLN